MLSRSPKFFMKPLLCRSAQVRARFVGSMGIGKGKLPKASFLKCLPRTDGLAPSLGGALDALAEWAFPAGPPEGMYKLRYFDARGTAETIRLIFAIAEVEYEDARYSFSTRSPGNFGSVVSPQFDEDQKNGKMKVGMNKVPILDAGPCFSLPQSKAIERYLARKFRMMGDTDEEAAIVDAIAEHVRDIHEAFRRKCGPSSGDESKKKEWFKKELPEFLRALEDVLPKNAPVGFSINCKRMSYADLVIFRLLHDSYPPEWASDIQAAYSDRARIKGIVEKLSQDERIIKWFHSRPRTTF